MSDKRENVWVTLKGPFAAASQGEYLGLSVSGLIAELQEALEHIPVDARASAIFRVADLDEDRMDTEIAYQRPETDAEMAKRIREQREIAKVQEDYERRQYERLQQKFGHPE